MNRPFLSGRTLIGLSIAAACAGALPVSAATAVVLDRRLPPAVKVTHTEFAVDERAGTARLAVDLYDDTWDGYASTESLDVPGLTFDRERREVRYESEGSVVTCARRGKFLWATTWPATGACRIVVRQEAPTADAGSGARTEWVVELVTDAPARAARLGR